MFRAWLGTAALERLTDNIYEQISKMYKERLKNFFTSFLNKIISIILINKLQSRKNPLNTYRLKDLLLAILG